jgi:ABC-type branched-subunit amino acid transport system substrate-binding protein
MAYRALCKQRDLCRIAVLPLVLTGCCLFLTTCSFPGSVKPTVKIGLSAPFEGRDRDLGYDVLHAVRLAVQQRNEAGGVGERYLVELVALNDFNEPEEAILQAREMAVDRDVLGVLGGWSPATSAAAAPEYRRLGLAFLSAAMDWSQVSDSAPVFEDPVFVAGFRRGESSVGRC